MLANITGLYNMDNGQNNDADEQTDPLNNSPALLKTIPLTNWENEPTVFDLSKDLLDAKMDADAHISSVDNWIDNLNITGKARLAKTKINNNRSTMVPKLIRKQAEWRYASLTEPFLSTKDMFTISPVTYEDKDAAIQNELVLNNQFNTKVNKTRFIDDYVRTAVDEGTVIVRVGWDYIEETETIKVPNIKYAVTEDINIIDQLHQATQLKQQSPDTYKQLPEVLQNSVNLTLQHNAPVAGKIVGYHEEPKIKIIKNAPTLEVCFYKNISIDPTALGDIDKAKFLIYSFESSLAMLKKDGRYTNLDKINVLGNSILSEPYHTSSDASNFNFKDKARRKFVVYEYWGEWDIDGTGETTPITASWVGSTLIQLRKNPFPDQKIPFIIAQYLPVRRSMYGQPDGYLLEDNQKIIGAVTRGMIDTMGRSANGQTGVRKDALDITNRNKFNKGEDYEFNAQVDPRQAFYMHTYPEIPASAQFMLGMQNADAESLTGIKAFSSGVGINGNALGDNVGGIKSALDAASKRELGILRRLANGIEQIGRKIISMNSEFLSDTEVIRITNEKFVQVKKDDLPGNFDLTLAINTPEADSEKAQELAFMLQTTGQTMGQDFSKLILEDIARLRKMPELAKKISDFDTTPDPAIAQKTKLELSLLQAKINNEISKTNENNVQMELNKAKIANINSSTDIQDLDFLEQESGTKQERALQRQGEQARSNIQLKVAEHSMKAASVASNLTPKVKKS